MKGGKVRINKRLILEIYLILMVLNFVIGNYFIEKENKDLRKRLEEWAQFCEDNSYSISYVQN